MYCRYDYNAGATAANVMADIVAILTGTTSTAGLSAACNKGTSVIISTVAAGWTVHDSAAGSGAQVLKAPFADASGYKYLWLNITSTPNYQWQIAEAWNAGTHTGTNLVNMGTASAGLSLTAGGTIFLFAAATHFHWLFFTGSTYGILGSVMERTRMSLWDTSGVGVPPFIGTGSSGIGTYNGATVFGVRTKSATFTDVLGASAAYQSVTIWGQQGSNSSGASVFNSFLSVKSPDTSGVAQYVTTDVYVSYATRGDMGGQLYGIKQISQGGNTSDDATVGGQTWFYVASAQVGNGGSQAPSFCLPKF